MRIVFYRHPVTAPFKIGEQWQHQRGNVFISLIERDVLVIVKHTDVPGEPEIMIALATLCIRHHRAGMAVAPLPVQRILLRIGTRARYDTHIYSLTAHRTQEPACKNLCLWNKCNQVVFAPRIKVAILCFYSFALLAERCIGSHGMRAPLPVQRVLVKAIGFQKTLIKQHIRLQILVSHAKRNFIL